MPPKKSKPKFKRGKSGNLSNSGDAGDNIDKMATLDLASGGRQDGAGMMEDEVEVSILEDSESDDVGLEIEGTGQNDNKQDADLLVANKKDGAGLETVEGACGGQDGGSTHAANENTETAASCTGEGECAFCHEQLSQPKILPCGHLLCQHCLLDLLQTSPSASCPICRSTIEFSDDPEDFVVKLPTDVAMAALVESRHMLKGQHNCQACQTEISTHICLTCHDFYCSRCAALHKRMTATRDHDVQELSEVTAEQLASNKPFFCQTHVDQMCKIYCPTHGTSVCLQCATDSHKQCPDVKSRDQRADKVKADLAQLTTKMRAAQAEIQAAIQQLDPHLETNERRIESSVQEIRTTWNRLRDALNTGQQRLERLVREGGVDVVNTVADAKAILLARQGIMTSHDDIMQRFGSLAQREDIADDVEKLMERVHSLHHTVLLPATAKEVCQVKLEIKPGELARLEEELSSFGAVTLEPAGHIAAKPKPKPPFQFSNNCGTKIVLTNNQKTSERPDDDNPRNGIVLSTDPMQVNWLYEVRIDGTRDKWNYQFPLLGVVTQSNDIKLPDCGEDLTSSVVVRAYSIKTNGVLVRTTKQSRIRDLRNGDRVGLALNNRRKLLLYINGDEECELAEHIASPCYFMVDLGFCWTKATALPVKPLP